MERQRVFGVIVLLFGLWSGCLTVEVSPTPPPTPTTFTHPTSSPSPTSTLTPTPSSATVSPSPSPTSTLTPTPSSATVSPSPSPTSSLTPTPSSATVSPSPSPTSSLTPTPSSATVSPSPSPTPTPSPTANSPSSPSASPTLAPISSITPTPKGLAVVYVAPNGTSASICGASPRTACSSIRTAVNNAANNATIMMLSATYLAEPLQIDKALHLQGTNGMATITCSKMYYGEVVFNISSLAPIFSAQHISFTSCLFPISMRGSNSSFSTMALTNCSFSGTESSTLSTNRLSTAVSTSLVDVMVTDSSFQKFVGSAVHITDAATVTIQGCTFSNNVLLAREETVSGGALHLEQCRDVVLTGCDFIRNEVRVGRKFQSTFIYGGSVMINTVGEAETPGSQFSAIVADCNFVGSFSQDTLNTLYGGSLFIYCNGNNNTVTDVVLRNIQFNSSSFGGSSLYGGEMGIDVYGGNASVHVANITSDGSAFYSDWFASATNFFFNFSPTLHVSHLRVINAQDGPWGRSMNNPYSIMIKTSLLEGISYTFLDHVVIDVEDAEMGGLSVQTTSEPGSTLELRNSYFNGCYSKNLGGGCAALTTNGYMLIENNTFLNCVVAASSSTGWMAGGALLVTPLFSADASGGVTIQSNYFGQNSAQIGGALYVKAVENITVSSCEFSGNSALLGAAIATGVLELFTTDSSRAWVYDSRFYGNAAAGGLLAGMIASGFYGNRTSPIWCQTCEFGNNTITYQTENLIATNPISTAGSCPPSALYLPPLDPFEYEGWLVDYFGTRVLGYRLLDSLNVELELYTNCMWPGDFHDLQQLNPITAEAYFGQTTVIPIYGTGSCPVTYTAFTASIPWSISSITCQVYFQGCPSDSSGTTYCCEGSFDSFTGTCTEDYYYNNGYSSEGSNSTWIYITVGVLVGVSVLAVCIAVALQYARRRRLLALEYESLGGNGEPRPSYGTTPNYTNNNNPHAINQHQYNPHTINQDQYNPAPPLQSTPDAATMPQYSNEMNRTDSFDPNPTGENLDNYGWKPPEGYPLS